MKKVLLLCLYIFTLQASILSDEQLHRFSHSNGVLTDSFAGMKWQDNSDVKTIERDLEGAKNYCRKLTLDGKSDWRLPNIDELQYAYKIRSKLHYISPHNDRDYWSSSLDVSVSSVAWYVSFRTGGTYYSRKSRKYYVRCVRGREYDTLTLLEKQVKVSIVKEKARAKEKARKKYILNLTSAYKKAKKQNTISAYEKFIKKYPRTSKAKDAISRLYALVKNLNTITEYEKFIKKYPKSSEAKDAIGRVYNFIQKENNIAGYEWFIEKYPKSPESKDALSKMYALIQKQNNIAGYEWFIKKYPYASETRDAIKNMHKLAFLKAKRLNTLSAYNTFIISYPYAHEIKEALTVSYNIEAQKYKNSKKDDELKARLLAVKIKKMTIRMRKQKDKMGYELVIDRMSRLLTDGYEETDASLRYYESKEFTEFASRFDRTMRDIQTVLNKIESNTKNIQNNTRDLGMYAQQMIEISRDGFADAKSDRAMTAYYEAEKTKWDKFMHFRDKGYQ